MASFSDFMASKATPAPSGSGSFSNFMASKAPEQPAQSDATDIWDATKAYLHKQVENLSPTNIPAGVQSLLHPFTPEMANMREQANKEWDNGQYLDALNHATGGTIPYVGAPVARTIDAINAYASGKGSAADVGTNAADATAAKVVPAVYGKVLGSTVAGVKVAAPVVADVGGKIVQSEPWQITKDASAIVPVVGWKVSAGMRGVEGIIKLAKKLSNSTLDPATHQQLTVAAQDGTLAALPTEAKTALTQAVKTGDIDTIKSILDGNRAHSAVAGVDLATQNKVAVLAKYVKDHSIDLSSITPEGRQALADAAYGHGIKNGMTVPKNGYRGISDDTWGLVKNAAGAGN